jgi:NADPH:quinone reductase-like Zn-dependent oxidoreductase
MRAAHIVKHGGLDQLKIGEVNDLTLGPNEVLIKTSFAALNHVDLFIIKGWPGLNLKMPHVIGSDASGIVSDVGDNVSEETIKKGNSVVINPGLSCGVCYHCLAGRQNFCRSFSIIGEHQWGTFAEFFKVPQENVLHIPSEYSMEKAAAAPLTFLTAWRALKNQAELKVGETILIQGASGGVSVAAIQIAKYLGANVITTTSSDVKVRKAREIGADYAMDYNQIPDYGRYIYNELTNRNGVDVILDSVGSSTFGDSLRLLKPGGRLVVPGATTGPLVEIDLRQIFWKQLEIKGTTMSNQVEFRDVMNLVFEGKLSPIVDDIFEFEDIRNAETYLSEAKQFGKILITI